jgi:pimeloyl-ACP methyl ester carboxylesterase
MSATRLIAAVALAAGLTLTGVPVASAAAGSVPSATQARYCAASDTYRLHTCDGPPRLPNSPVGRQLAWLLPHLADGGVRLTPAEVTRHVDPSLLEFLPAQSYVDAVRGAAQELGGLRFVGFNYPPRSDGAVAVLEGNGGVRAAAGLGVRLPGELVSETQETLAPPTIVPHGRYSGWFDVGGRRLFMRCTGTGGPTVVFENGLTSDWFDVQNAVSRTTRACSYDPALQNSPFTRSDPAPTPRHGRAVVQDMDRLFQAAQLPGPYVLVGHSNGGLFSLLYASLHPGQVAGLVLVDGVHPGYHRRDVAMLKDHLDPETWQQVEASACQILPEVLDSEQMDICRSEAQTRRSLHHSPVHAMPLSVISHGLPGEYPPGWPADAEEALWTQLQNELAALVPGSHHVIAHRSHHPIHTEQPKLVVREIRRVVAAVRAGATTAQ